METSPYVSAWYAANAESEDIVFGDQLRDGMTVLIEDRMARQNVDNIRSEYDRARADEMNRWCKVTRYQLIKTGDWPTVKFVGVYPDGSMRVRVMAASYGWIVKRGGIAR